MAFSGGGGNHIRIFYQLDWAFEHSNRTYRNQPYWIISIQHSYILKLVLMKEILSSGKTIDLRWSHNSYVSFSRLITVKNYDEIDSAILSHNTEWRITLNYIRVRSNSEYIILEFVQYTTAIARCEICPPASEHYTNLFALFQPYRKHCEKGSEVHRPNHTPLARWENASANFRWTHVSTPIKVQEQCGANSFKILFSF